MGWGERPVPAENAGLDRVPAEILTQDEWLRYGVERGWCSAPVCSTHEGIPLTDDEEQAFEEGWDPCVPAVRLT